MSHEARLDDVLDELLAAGERPDADVLEEMVGRYPRYAAELTDFAVEWALQDLLPEDAPAPAGAGEATSAVPAAMRRFRRRLDELDRARAAGEAAGRDAEPFAGRDAAELTRVAAALGLDKTLMAKLRDRKIVAETIPGALVDGLAAELEVGAGVLAAYFAAPAGVHAGASFKAARAPEAGAKETFAEAVRRSFLGDGAKARWLAAGSEGD